MEIVTVTTQKGGTGKTTTALILASAAAEIGLNVLLIDLDPQFNLSFATGADIHHHGALELLNGMQFDRCRQTITKNIDIVSGSWGLQAFNMSRDEMKQLCQILPPLEKEYDLILIDTPATAGKLQYNAIKAATTILIPLQATIYSMQSLDMIAETGKHAHRKKPIRAAFIFANIDNRKKKITETMAKKIILSAKEKNIAYIGKVSNAAAVEEAITLKKSLYEYAPNCKPAKEYMDILRRLLPQK